MTFARVEQRLVHYRIKGAGPRVAFLNSLGTDMRIWDAVVERLADRFECLLADMRGHGLSDAPAGPYAISGLADDTLGLLDHLGWGRVHLVGLSVGGLVAQEIAARAPARVAALALLDTAARIGEPAMWNERIAAVEAGGTAAIADGVIRRWFSAGYLSREPDAAAGWRNMLARTPSAGYAATCAAIRDADLTERLAAIRAPTLVLVGDEDQSTPPDLVRATADRIAASRFEVVAGAGHLPPAEQPAETARLLALHFERSHP
ncbi:3-oxoadipate enol-lactonase [Aureimonas jatrophae]|uniref:3-oxoadipate enol-lactonase n=1 Tax=Aureimonas jatrophae TaxID=1166073 RepID=A0A1H0EZY9_9HYPH|nr:3-oxoadipate enol-lactonase [Aureimonas jatrophae]MBB3950241.1 3-oxoadipate enol-lactonase [Aureimonas jatrophae]SDN87869.1 3-oxoadipate enol-lactonase [Aureimonas jatrophae]